MDCEETFKKMQDYLDRELTSAEMLLVREHLDQCGMCAEEYLFEESILRRVGKILQNAYVPDDLFERVSAFLDRA